MGFATGFTGGVALTLSVTYLTVLSHQQNRGRQCDMLRLNASIIESMATSDPSATAHLSSPTAPGNTTPQLCYARQEALRLPRTTFADELKARWNAEVEGAVRWVQNKDWAEVREDAEAAASYLWSQAVSSDKVDAATTAFKQTAASVTGSVATEAQSIRDVAAAAAGPRRVIDTINKESEIEKALQRRYIHDKEDPKKSVGELLEERYQHKA